MKSDRLSDDLRSARNLIRGDEHPRILSDVRRSVRPENYDRFLSWLRTTPLQIKFLNKAEYPRLFRDLKSFYSDVALSAANEFAWATACLKHHHQRLNRFMYLSSEFQKAILQDEFADAEASLELIENEFGVSLWLIKNRIACLQRHRGLEAQKAFATEVKSSQAWGTFVGFITHYVSFKNEATSSPARFSDTTVRHISSQRNLPAGLGSYLRFHILDDTNPTSRQIAEILHYEYLSPIIDYYETCVQMAHYACARNVSEASFFVDSLCDVVDDVRLSRLQFSFGAGNNSLSRIPALRIEAFDELLSGRYETALESGLRSALIEPNQTSNLYVAALASVLSDRAIEEQPDSLFRQIIRHLSAVLVKGEDTARSVVALMKINLTFSGHLWSDALLAHVVAEITPNPLAETPKTQALIDSALSPLRVIDVDRKLRAPFAAHLAAQYKNSLSSRYALALIGEHIPDDIDHDQAHLLRIKLALEAEKFSEALGSAQTLLASQRPYFQQNANRIISHCYLQSGEIKKCIEHLTSCYVANRDMHFVLPLSDTLDKVDPGLHRDLCNDPSLAILYDAYSRHVGADFDTQRGYAFEDFLAAHGATRPSDTKLLRLGFSREKMIYFLRYICIPNIMDSSIYFDSSRELEAERINVCRALAELDPANVDLYQSEIKDITKREMIYRGLRQVEQSRIYVDTAGIRQVADKKLRETFDRYMSLRKLSPIGAADDRLERAIEQAADGDSQALQLLNLPRNEMHDVLEQLIVEMRDEFVSSTEHGLDGYLSVRIRHGTLSGALRSPLEAARLISQRDRSNGSYKSNHYWRNRLSADSADIEKIMIHLTQFSRDFDDLIGKISGQWLQVKKSTEEQGLFDFIFTRGWVRLLGTYIKEDTTFEEFVEMVLRTLNARLEHNLEAIRKILSTELKSEVTDLFLRLQSDMVDFVGGHDIAELANAIKNAQTETLTAINRVIEWFKLSPATTNLDFVLQDAVEISLQAVRNYYQDSEIKVDMKDDTQIYLKGPYLTPFVDIFFLIFENIVRHSDTQGNPRIEVTISDLGHAIRILVENEIGIGVDNSAARARLEAIRAALAQGQYKKSVSREGGTGFHKIRKILEHDIGGTSQLEFGFTGTGKFAIELRIYYQRIMLSRGALA